MLDHLPSLLAPHGLSVRGALHPPDPAIGTLVLVGTLGGAPWSAFESARRDEPHSLDAWTRRVVHPIAAAVGARALFPFDGPPWFPFQTWAMAAEGLKPSPIGVLLHPDAGLWHAYRAALAFEARLPLPARAPTAHACDSCTEQPCLSACPVNALTPGTYDVPACRQEALGPDRGDCRALGCAARRACPMGTGSRYPAAQLAFHMTAFLEE